METNESLDLRIREYMRTGRFAEAQIACIAGMPESSQQRAELLDEIDRASRERSDVSIPTAYHQWYYDSVVWQSIRWLGIQVFKSPMDLWVYQEILTEMRPNLIIEFGTHAGGSAVYFADILDDLGIDGEVITIDITMEHVADLARTRNSIRFIESSSIDPAVKATLKLAAAQRPGRIFAILDSDHSKAHVYAEMVMMRDILRAGDYLVVEDGNINGHPVLPQWGPGPYEAVEQYVAEFPDDYTFDLAREHKFGFTFAPHGFLVRNA